MAKKSRKPLPKTIDEAVDFVLARLSDEDKEQLRETPKDRLIEHHFGLGMWIRNKLRLWDTKIDISEPISELKFMLPDDASMRILEGMWEKLQQSESKGEGYVR